MGINKQLLMELFLMILLGLFVVGVAEYTYVDSYHQGHSIYNVSNITITGIFRDSTMKIYNGRIWNATEINATKFFQNGTQVPTTAYIISVNNTMKLYVDSRDAVVNGSMVVYVTNANSTIWNYIGTVNTSLYNLINETNNTLRGYVIATNDTMRGYVNAQDIIFNNSMVLYVSDVNGTMTAYVDNKFIPKNGNANLSSLNVSGHTNLGSVNFTVGYEGPYEVATLNDLTQGNVTVTSIISVQNAAGTTADKGRAMTFSGYNVGADRYDVVFANNTDVNYHAHCLLLGTLEAGANGQCVVFGVIENMDTSGWSESDDIYLNSSLGTMVNSTPSTANCIQKVGVVLRSNVATGAVYVHGAGRCNDVPYNIHIEGNVTADWFDGKVPWTNLTYYPNACPANTYVSAINDSTTCTGISDVYVLNTGDVMTGPLNVSGAVNAYNLSGTLDCDNISNAASNLCTITDTDTDTHFLGDGAYIYNASNTYYFNVTKANEQYSNDTRLNATIDARSINVNELNNESLIYSWNTSFVTGAQTTYNNNSFDLSAIPMSTNRTLNQNITFTSKRYLFFDIDGNSSIHYNGTSLVIKVN